MKRKITPKFLMVAGLVELFLGLGLSLAIGTQISWDAGLILAIAFFVSANILFIFALKRA